jgi:hypothetical protein
MTETNQTVEVLGVEVSRVRLTTTLGRLRQHYACEDRYDYLVHHLPSNWSDYREINLLTILELNGTEDALWALVAVQENCEQIARLMAADFAEKVLPNYEDRYPDRDGPRKAIEAARRYALGQISASAAGAACSAAWSAAWVAEAAARDAAGDAAGDAARAVVEAAAGSARAAAWSAAEAAAKAAWAASEVAAGSAWSAWDAAWAASWDAWDAAGSAMRAAQAEIMRRYLLTNEEATL